MNSSMNSGNNMSMNSLNTSHNAERIASLGEKLSQIQVHKIN